MSKGKVLHMGLIPHTPNSGRGEMVMTVTAITLNDFRVSEHENSALDVGLVVTQLEKDADSCMAHEIIVE
jgi:hypothetical protein